MARGLDKAAIANIAARGGVPGECVDRLAAERAGIDIAVELRGIIAPENRSARIARVQRIVEYQYAGIDIEILRRGGIALAEIIPADADVATGGALTVIGQQLAMRRAAEARVARGINDRAVQQRDIIAGDRHLATALAGVTPAGIQRAGNQHGAGALLRALLGRDVSLDGVAALGGDDDLPVLHAHALGL